MEAKKSPEADLEKRKRSFLFAGLLVSLAFVLVGMEYTQFDRKASDLGDLNKEFMEEEVVPPSAAPPPPPPPPPAPSTVVEIVEDEEDIEETEQVFEEPDEETVVEEVVEEEEEVSNEIFTIVEDPASFPGGESELFKYLGKTLKYPAMAQDAGISGTVYVKFVVDRDGKVKSPQVLRPVHSALDKEAIRVVNAMPKWKPGRQRGKAVPVYFTLPVKFSLK